MEPTQLLKEVMQQRNIPLATLIVAIFAGLSNRYKLAWALLICTFISTARIADMF